MIDEKVKPENASASKIDKYADIINLPRPEMQHPRMSSEARAGQFAPFAALVGFYDLVQKESRDKLEEVAMEEMVEVDIDAQIELDDGI